MYDTVYCRDDRDAHLEVVKPYLEEGVSEFAWVPLGLRLKLLPNGKVKINNLSDEVSSSLFINTCLLYERMKADGNYRNPILPSLEVTEFVNPASLVDNKIHNFFQICHIHVRITQIDILVIFCSEFIFLNQQPSELTTFSVSNLHN